MRRWRPHPVQLLGWPLVVLLLVGPGRPTTPSSAAATKTPLQRLLGPVAQLASDVQWIRFQEARLAGRHDLALARAESALGFAPAAPGGWELLAGHYGLFLASPQREPDPVRRLHWFQAGLAVLARGAEQSDEPARLARLRAALFLSKLEDDPELPWPGGADAMGEEAVRATEEADRLEAAAQRDS